MKLILFTVFLTASANQINANYMEDYENLITHLLAGYNRLIRPVQNRTDVLNVTITFRLTNIRDVNEVAGTVIIVGGFVIMWRDLRMRWDPRLYNGLTSVTVPIKWAWIPDLIVGNSVDPFRPLAHDGTFIQYSSSGEAFWYIADAVKVSCPVNIKYYPFDVQTILLGVFSNRYRSPEILLQATKKEALTDMYVNNGEWKLLKTEITVLNVGTSIFQVKLVLERRPTFVVVILIVPVLVMGFISTLVFVLPAASGERMSYTITILLSQAIFLTIISDNIPETSSPLSLLCHFIWSQVAMSSCICIGTVLNLRFFYVNENSPVSSWANLLCKKCSSCQRVYKLSSTGGGLSLGTQELGIENADKVTSKGRLSSKTNDSVPHESIKRKEFSIKLDRLFFFLALSYFFISCSVFGLLFAMRDESESPNFFWEQ